MAFEVHCGECGARFTLPDDLFERKVKGRVVTVRCKKCRGDIHLDGRDAKAQEAEPIDMTPTIPLTHPRGEPLGAAPGLWVVSFGDDDDRELTIAQIEQALDGNKIDAATLVWNQQMDEWKQLGQVPELKALVKVKQAEEKVGGFLGTGVPVRAKGPPPLPGGDDVEMLGDDEIGPFRSVSAGTFDLDEEQAKNDEVVSSKSIESAAPSTPRSLEDSDIPSIKEEPKQAAKVEPEKVEPEKVEDKRLPKAPSRSRPAWNKPEPTPQPAKAEEDEEAAPTSGTPDLRSLTTAIAGGKSDGSGPPSDDIFAIGSGSITAALPTIDLSSLSPPSSGRRSAIEVDDADIEDAPPSSARVPPVKPKGKAKATPKPPRPPGAASDKPKGPPPLRRNDTEQTAKTLPPARARTTDSKRPVAASEPEPERAASPVTWLLIGGAALAVIYWFFLRPKPVDTTAPPQPTQAATNEPVAPPVGTEPTPPSTVILDLPENAADAALYADLPRNDAGKIIMRPEEEGRTKLVEPKATPDAGKPSEGKMPPTAETGAEVTMAPPFDANAARTALTSAAGAAARCRQEGDPSGSATVVVTFAPSGRVTTANISGPPFAGTKTGGCIASAMRGAKIPAFSGAAMTVSKSVVVQ